MKSFIKAISYLLFLGLTVQMIAVMYVLWDFALSACIYDYFGEAFCVVFALLIVAVVISPIWLRKFIKEKHIIPLAASALVFVIFLIFMLLYHVSAHHFQIFTSEGWRELPNQRMRMIDDLEENYDIIGSSVERVEALLGTPDEIQNSGDVVIYQYYYDFGFIDCVFKNGELSHISHSDYW